MISVSVPFRGISFPNTVLLLTFVEVSKSVSVPFRGISFPNFEEFQSVEAENGFRPLPGHLISKLSNAKNPSQGPIVSVPFRGISFPNK